MAETDSLTLNEIMALEPGLLTEALVMRLRGDVPAGVSTDLSVAVVLLEEMAAAEEMVTLHQRRRRLSTAHRFECCFPRRTRPTHTGGGSFGAGRAHGHGVRYSTYPVLGWDDQLPAMAIVRCWLRWKCNQ